MGRFKERQMSVFNRTGEPTQPAFGTDPRKLYRQSPIDTSRDAAHSVTASVLERRVYHVVFGFGSGGATSDDIRGSSYLHGLSYSSVMARLKALKDKGLIVDSGRRRPGRSGRGQAVLVAKPHFNG